MVFGRVMTYRAGFGLLAVDHHVRTGALQLLTSERYFAASTAIAPLAIGLRAMASTQITAGGISLVKRTKYLAVFARLAAAGNVVLNLALDRPYGMLGAAWSTAAAYTGLTLLYLVTSQRLWPVRYDPALRHPGPLILAFTLAAGFLPSGFNLGALTIKVAYRLGVRAAAFALRAVDGREIGGHAILLARIRR